MCPELKRVLINWDNGQVDVLSAALVDFDKGFLLVSGGGKTMMFNMAYIRKVETSDI